MADASSLPSQCSHFIFVLVNSMLVFDPQWTNLICYYIAPLLSRLSEGNLPPQVYIVTYSPDSRVVVGPFYVAGRFDEANLRFPTAGMMKRNSLDMAALDGYMSIIEVFDDFQKEHKQDLNERFSYHLWHIVVGQHDDAEYHHSDVLTASPGPNWESVHGELTNRNINLSMILTNPCPKLLQLFFATSRTHILPWFDTSPHHEILLSRAFVPFGDLEGVVQSTVSAEHPVLLDSVSSATVGGNALRYDFRSLRNVVTVLNPVEDTQAFNSAAVQIQPYVSSGQEQIPMSWLVYPHGSGVEQQQPMSHDYTEASGASRDLAIPSAGPTTLGAIHVMTGDKWTGRLCLDGAYVCAQARAEEATRDPMLSEWPEDLQLELVAVPNISTLDIQAWMLNVKAAVVRLRCPDQMDNRNFDQFVRELREHQGYAIVKWEKQGRALDRLLLVPGGKVLHCAAFLDDNIPEHQESRRIRTLKPRESSQKKKGSRRGPHPGPVATPTSPEGAYYEAAQSNPIADSEEMEDSWIRMRTKTETVTTVTATAGTVCKSPYLCKM